MTETARPWYEVVDPREIPTPALLVYPELVAANVRRLIEIAGGTERLRPHVKTHKMADVARLQVFMGITRFKCATIAEAEMLAESRAPDVLLAYPLVGPQPARAALLAARFRSTRFSFLADDAAAIRCLSDAFAARGDVADVLLDLNVGMDRTGVDPTLPTAMELYRLLSNLPGVRPGGLHAYDGHISDTDLARRTELCDKAFEPVQRLAQQIGAEGLAMPRIVAGGTPTFPIHAHRANVECSPGTCIFWDFGYSDKLPDLVFDYAAVLMTRVVSRPSPARVCLDLGYKAVAADQPQPRVRLLEVPDAEFITHNEEHLVFDTPRADQFPVGKVLYAVPRHICPTVALHREAYVVRDGAVVGTWPVTARDRRLTV